MKLRNANILTIVGLLVFCIIIFLPPIMYGYVYPNVGDDSAQHLQMLDSMQEGDSILGMKFLGYAIVGYPLIFVCNLTGSSIDTVYLWFAYVVLVLVGITLYLVVSRLVNKKAGWFALIITIFCAQGIMFQFYFGQLFNLINMGIILPLAIYFVAKYLTNKRFYQLLLALIFILVFSTFHISGIYLPFITGMAVVVYVICKLVKRQRIYTHTVVVGIGIIVVSAIMFWIFLPNRVSITGGALSTLGQAMAVPIADYIFGIVSPSVLVALLFIAIFSKDILKNIRMETKILIAVLSYMTILLVVATFARLSLDPWRQALDLATVLAILAAVFIGLALRLRKDKLMITAVVILVSFGLFHNIPSWLDYNSAIRPADKEAISYINTLDCELYNCSAEVAPWIYSRFIELEHRAESKYYEDCETLLITRSSPMTPRSTIGNMWYSGHGVTPDDSDILIGEFKDSKVVVQVYKRR